MLEILRRTGILTLIAWAGFFAGTWHGRYLEQDSTIKERDHYQQEQIDLRASSARRVAAAELSAENERRNAREQIQRLLKSNHEAADWYSTRVPTSVAESLWGVRFESERNAAGGLRTNSAASPDPAGSTGDDQRRSLRGVDGHTAINRN